MTMHTETVAVAEKFLAKSDDELEVILGLREKKIGEQPDLAADPNLPVMYDSTHLGLLNDARDIGKRILKRWNKELHGLVCHPKNPEAQKLGEVIANAAGVKGGVEAALIAAVVSALLVLSLSPAIAAVVAPIVVRKFIVPAGDELCMAWEEGIAKEG